MPYDNHGRWIPPDDNWRTGKYLVSHKHGWREADAEEIASGQAVNKGSDKDSTYRGQMSWDQIFARDQMDNKARGYDFKGLIESGLIGDLFPTQYDSDGKVDVDKTIHMFNTSHYNQADNEMRYELLRQFQDYYHGDDSIHWADDGKVNVLEDGKWVETTTITGFSDELREDLNWGLDIQRAWYADKDFIDWEIKVTIKFSNN